MGFTLEHQQYVSGFGKTRRVDPEVASRESGKRQAYFNSVLAPELTRGFEQRGLANTLGLVGSVRDMMANEHSDIDILVSPPVGAGYPAQDKLADACKERERNKSWYSQSRPRAHHESFAK